MSSLYGDFEQDNMENDDDMAALGSILSWDDDEERARNELTGQQQPPPNKQTESMPSFTNDNKDSDMSELSFFHQYLGSGGSSGMDGPVAQQQPVQMAPPNQDQQQHQYGQQQAQQQVLEQTNQQQQQQGQNTNFTPQQFASLQQMLQQQQQGQAQFGGQQPQQLQQPDQSQQQGQQQQSNQMASQIAQFVAQQALSMLQQNQQAETQRKEQEKVQQQQDQQVRQQQQHHQQSQQAMNTMAMLQQNLQRAMQQQSQNTGGQQQDGQQQAAMAAAVQQGQQAMQQQSTSSQQPQFSNMNDQSSFLQQLQIAQLQQQYQAAQQQQQHSNQQSVTSQAQALQQQLQSAQPKTQAAALQQQQLQALATAIRSQQQFQQQLPQSVQEQLQQQYAQVAGNVQIQAPSKSSAAASAMSECDNKPSTSKKSKAGAKKSAGNSSSGSINKKDSPDEQTSSNVKTESLVAAAAGIVSASDTDNELNRKISALKKGGRDDDEDDDEIDDEIDMSHLTPEERAVMNRERNKEHARNTRLRKKAYLEKLKATVDDLCKERNTLVSERASAANLLVEMHNTRTEVLMSFFALRSTNEKRRHLWASILDESCFACIMPITPYRSFPASEMQVSKCQRTILGIDGAMGDTASLHVLFASLVDRIKAPLGRIEFRYTLVAEEAVVAGNQMMARWVMSTTNAMQCGAKMEVYKQGMLCSRFNSSHKIVGLELMFDVMAFMLQLKQAAGVESFTVIPNTVQTCQRTFEKPVVMTSAEPPYLIVQVNKLWEEMTGYSADEVVGKVSCTILQGAMTDQKTVEDMMTEVRYKRATSASLINYKKSGEAYRTFLCLYPLSTDSRIAHFLAITEHFDDGELTASGAHKMNSMSQMPPMPLPLLSIFQQGTQHAQQGMMQLTRNVNITAEASNGQQTYQRNNSSTSLVADVNVHVLPADSDTGNKRSHDSSR